MQMQNFPVVIGDVVIIKRDESPVVGNVVIIEKEKFESETDIESGSETDDETYIQH